MQDDVEESWYARPNFGDYGSSELLGFNQFVMTWSEGKFPPPMPRRVILIGLQALPKSVPRHRLALFVIMEW